jgi:hypothetical protein
MNKITLKRRNLLSRFNELGGQQLLSDLISSEPRGSIRLPPLMIPGKEYATLAFSSIQIWRLLYVGELMNLGQYNYG